MMSEICKEKTRMYEERSFLPARFRFAALSLHRVTWALSLSAVNAGSNHLRSCPGVRGDSGWVVKRLEQGTATC